MTFNPVFRYEDICQEPFEYAGKFYEYAGLEMTTATTAWITKHIQVSLGYILEYL